MTLSHSIGLTCWSRVASLPSLVTASASPRPCDLLACQLVSRRKDHGQVSALLHDSTAARVGALFQLLVQDTTAQDFGLPSSAIRLRM